MSEIVLKIDGDEITCDWWTPETKEFFCSLCLKKNTEKCDPITCQISNPYCG